MSELTFRPTTNYAGVVYEVIDQNGARIGVVGTRTCSKCGTIAYYGGSEREAAAATPSPFRQVVDDLTGGDGCACHTGTGYNTACRHCQPHLYHEAAAATPSLDVERLAEAWFVGIQAQSGRTKAEALDRWNDGSEDMDYMRGKYFDVARHALARLDEGSATPEQSRMMGER